MLICHQKHHHHHQIKIICHQRRRLLNLNKPLRHPKIHLQMFIYLLLLPSLLMEINCHRFLLIAHKGMNTTLRHQTAQWSGTSVICARPGNGAQTDRQTDNVWQPPRQRHMHCGRTTAVAITEQPRAVRYIKLCTLIRMWSRSYLVFVIILHYVDCLLAFLRWLQSPLQLHRVGEKNVFELLFVNKLFLEGVVAHLLFQQ